MEFVDRTDEMARIKATLSRRSSSLVVIYGRRRLGKSTLRGHFINFEGLLKYWWDKYV